MATAPDIRAHPARRTPPPRTYVGAPPPLSERPDAVGSIVPDMGRITSRSSMCRSPSSARTLRPQHSRAPSFAPLPRYRSARPAPVRSLSPLRSLLRQFARSLSQLARSPTTRSYLVPCAEASVLGSQAMQRALRTQATQKALRTRSRDDIGWASTSVVGGVGPGSSVSLYSPVRVADPQRADLRRAP
ncbi:hypothetical protein C8J57DRAFT_1304494 [Mycena rebaudengoi]|nr:hypothetical protein C8J57DRAFT_1304494 [Mycena rebaudengoi]